MRGVVAAGHPLTAEAGADALRAGGGAVDAALAALCAGFVCEPLLTGLGAGGYMLVCPPDGEDVLLDFFVEAAGRGREHRGHAPLVPVPVDFGDALQVYHAGAAAAGAYGMPAGICAAHGRYGRIGLDAIVAPAVRLAREGVVLNAQQALLFEILDGIIGVSEDARALFGAPRLGDTTRYPELAVLLERLAAEGDAPFYSGDIGEAVARAVSRRGGLLTMDDLRAYEVVAREPVRARYHGREVITNPPPSAGGTLIVAALEQLEAGASVVAALEHAQRLRTPAFLEQLGSTTHVSVVDAEGWACAVTVSNGEGSGIVVDGLHLNNMMGEEDLSPLGFFTHPPGRRLPSMMSPTVVRRDGAVEACLGSAGSNRIRSAIVQVVARIVSEGLGAQAAVDAPRLHWENGVVYCEPGAEVEAPEVVRFGAPNLFFGGAQCVTRDAAGRLSGAGDPRRGGAAVAV